MSFLTKSRVSFLTKIQWPWVRILTKSAIWRVSFLTKSWVSFLTKSFLLYREFSKEIREKTPKISTGILDINHMEILRNFLTIWIFWEKHTNPNLCEIWASIFKSLRRIFIYSERSWINDRNTKQPSVHNWPQRLEQPQLLWYFIFSITQFE